MAEVPQLTFAFQPLVNTRTGQPVAVEALARPQSGTVYDLLCDAGHAGQLTATDVALASSAVLAAAEAHTVGPLHLNVLASTAARAETLLSYLDVALRQAGRAPGDITLEISPPFCRVPRTELVGGLRALRRHGFHLAFDAVGNGDLPLSILVDVPPDMLKLDPRLLHGLPRDAAAVALVEAFAQLSARTGVRLAAVGVESGEQLVLLRRLGVRLAQGNLLAAPDHRAGAAVAVSQAAAELIELSPAAAPVDQTPLIADLLHDAATLAEDATADEVREVFAHQPDINGVVLVDRQHRPCASLDRSRFLLAVTGPYGHALHAKRAAFRHADPPRLIRWDATALQLLEMVGGSDGQRTGDDVVVVDGDGRCAGIVRLTEVVRCVAEAKVEQAAALNPLTRLPGTDAVAREIERRIARAEMFVVAWLDVDSFKSVNDTVGFAAGDDLIRALGQALSDAESDLPGTRVGHVGGDDFLVVADLDEIAPLAERLVDPLWTIEGMTVSVSLATLVCGIDSVGSYREASKLLAPLKKQAKAVPGSSWVLGRPNSQRVDILRGRARHSQLVS
ncbi:MAG TPA: GGDEF domain-containing protein [Actinophytocola sp.]|nr:GGDEF domain-containing protein [Actinophytocola sp.]HEV2780440.1 GGDEF domain-containing protein [Actinophytocola sp.]